MLVTFNLHDVVFISSAYTFFLLVSSLSMSPFFSSHRERTQPPTPPQLPLTTRRQIGTYGALSHFSLSLSRSFALSFLITLAIIWVSLSLYSQLFLPLYSFFFLSLSLSRAPARSLAFASISPELVEGPK